MKEERPLQSFSYYVCFDRGLDAHDWYRAPALDTSSEAWVLNVAKALPAGIMYVGRVDSSGKHQWLSPLGDPVMWAWWDLDLDPMPLLHRPRAPST